MSDPNDICRNGNGVYWTLTWRPCSNRCVRRVSVRKALTESGSSKNSDPRRCCDADRLRWASVDIDRLVREQVEPEPADGAAATAGSTRVNQNGETASGLGTVTR